MPKNSKPRPKSTAYTFDREKIHVSELGEIANLINGYLDAAKGAKGDLPQRWKANEDTYFCNNSTSVLIASNGGQSELPIWQSKCDRITGDIHRQMTSVYPIVQCLDESGAGRNVTDIELSMTTLAQRASYDTDHLRDLEFDAANTNNAYLRIRPSLDEEDGTVNGFDMDSIHPSNVFVHPAEVQNLSQALMIANGLNLMKWEVDERIEDGTYINHGGEIMGGDSYVGENQSQEDMGSENDGMLQPTRPVGKEDSNVILYEVIAKLKLKEEDPEDEKYRRYILTYWKEGNRILDIQPYGAKRGDKFEPYPEPWYVKYCIKRSRNNIWSKWSPANSFQAIQSTMSTLAEVAVQGTIFSALPTIVTEGGGSLPQKALTIQAGTILELPADCTMKQINNQFNPGMIEWAEQFYGEVGDGASGVSRLGTAENVPASTSATAAAGFLQAQNEAKSDYASIISDGVESTWRVMFWQFQIHAAEIIKNNKGRLPTELTPQKVQALNLRFEATGTSGASNPQVYIQKLQMVLELTQNDPAYDRNKIIQKIIELLDLPLQVEALLAPQLLLHPIALKSLLGPPFWFTPEEIAQKLAETLQQQDAMQHVQSAMGQIDPQQLQGLLAAQQQNAQGQQPGISPQTQTPPSPGIGSQGPPPSPGLPAPGAPGPSEPAQMDGQPGSGAAPG